MARVTLSTSMPFGAIHAITGGDPGSEMVASELYAKWHKNPLRLLVLDRHSFHDERLWMAYKDVCGENIDLLDEFIDDVCGGKITEKQAMHAINNRGDGWARASQDHSTVIVEQTIHTTTEVPETSVHKIAVVCAFVAMFVWLTRR